ncbi:uncharacterized protein LOC116026955 [Ipomoea triloba]|uniref:uncharacterized protein LOC116026955 n=1 Tax=Ipomoea triloba TaxID=35885 RepID=UPI00125E8489|nr:uncharacterized protein LOC116026955 [Ipomoea triloba]
MICLSWNCQGAASTAFRRTLKQLCRDHSPDIVCLFEPKVLGAHANSICISFGFENWVRVEVVGFSGGIWIFWKPSVSLEILRTHPQFISLQVYEQHSPPWTLSMVYGSPNRLLRKKLFSDLTANSPGTQPSWLVCGDFNSVISREEVNNPDCFNNARCADFKEWIFQEGLVDLGFEGTKFTWMRGINSDSFRAARLDRALSSVEWRLNFPNAIVNHLPMINSDHSPLLISCIPRHEFNGERKFKFNMAWTTHVDFQRCVKEAWVTDMELKANIRPSINV